ncbi:MFS transporter [Streptomyces sp. NPDC088354]|uniref:MFS transporter n=1 Tax=Streptomyces sp. NPDC088354 TaxID=3365856 RepID=UPI003805973C
MAHTATAAVAPVEPSRTHRRTGGGNRAVAQVHVLRACDGLATSVAAYVVPVVVYQLTGSTTWAGIVFVAEWLPRLLAIGVGGPLVDRVPARTVMAAPGLARGGLVAGDIAAYLAGAGPLAIAAVGVGCGVAAEVTYLAAESLGAAVATGAKAAGVQAVQTSIDQAAILTGPLLGGVLLLSGPQYGLGLVVALSRTAAVLSRTLNRPAHHPARDPQAVGGETGGQGGLRGGAAALKALLALVWLLATLASMNLLSALLQAATSVIVTGFGRSPAVTGAVWRARAAAAVLAAAACARLLKRIRLSSLALAASAGGAAATAAAGLAPSYLTYAAALAGLAACEGVAMVALRTARARLLPPKVFGSAVALMVLVLVAPMPLGGAVLALVPADRLGPALITVAVLHGLVTVAACRRLRCHRRVLDNPLPDPHLAPESGQSAGPLEFVRSTP